MCWMAAIPIAVSLVGGMMSAKNQQQQGDFQSGMLEQNAGFKEAAAQDTEQRGELDADRRRVATKQLIGAQRSAIAGNGIDVNSGSAAIMQDDAAQFGELDALTISNNAAREAYGYRVGASNDQMSAKNVKSNAKSNAMGSILGGIGGAFGSMGG